MTIQELINELEKIEDKSKTIGISYLDNEFTNLLRCENTISLVAYEDIDIRTDINDYDNLSCDYYL